MEKLKWCSRTLISAFTAGIMIGIGALIYLSCPNKIVGAFMFAIGLLTIVFYNMDLYTGRVGFVLEKGINKITNWIELLIIWLGNLIGTLFVGSIIHYSRVSTTLVETAEALCEIKTTDSIFSLLILGFFCGMLMYLAVNTAKKSKYEYKRILMILLCVATFILCGFEHCVANMAYFTIANAWNWSSIISILIITFGNSLGGLFLPFMGIIMEKMKLKV